MDKLCLKCKVTKNVDDGLFGRTKSSTNGWQDWCKECHREYDRAYYHSNQSRRKAQVRNRAKAQRLKLAELLMRHKSQGCSSCSEIDPCCMDFHHLRDKEFNVAEALNGGYCEQRVEAEIVKCIVICANCHRKLHSKLRCNPGHPDLHLMNP